MLTKFSFRILPKFILPLSSFLSSRFFAVKYGETPNPLCIKFIPDRDLPGITPGKEYKSLKESTDNKLSAKILEIQGVQRIMFGKDFVSVTKKETGDWNSLKPEISNVIEKYIDEYKESEPKQKSESEKLKEELFKKVRKEPDNEAVSMIRELIEFRIRPMLLDDGGDVQYRGFNSKTGVFFEREHKK